MLAMPTNDDNHELRIIDSISAYQLGPAPDPAARAATRALLAELGETAKRLGITCVMGPEPTIEFQPMVLITKLHDDQPGPVTYTCVKARAAGGSPLVADFSRFLLPDTKTKD